MTKVVLVHGLAGSSRWWGRVAERLEPAHEVHALDVPHALAPVEAAGWLAEWIERHGGPVALAGHSLGGMLTARVAGVRPDLVEKLVLVAPSGAEAPSTRRANVWPVARSVVGAHPRLLASLARDGLRAGPRSMWRASGVAASATVAELAAIEVPTLLVWGERDRLVPAARAELFRAAIPAARVVVLPRAGHVPMFEAPDALAEAMLDFLD